MIETKLVTLKPEDYSREERVINDYAGFGWVMAQRSVVTRTVDGNTKDVEHTITFQRDHDIPNRDKLDALFLRYTLKEKELSSARNAVAIPGSKYLISFLIWTAIFCAIFYPTVYPAFMELLWNPDTGTVILMIFLVLLLAACAGALIGLVPMGIADGIKQNKAANAIKDRVYAEMSAIAMEASQYLR